MNNSNLAQDHVDYYPPPSLRSSLKQKKTISLSLLGTWDIGTIEEAKRTISEYLLSIDLSITNTLILDFTSISKIDSAGVLLINNAIAPFKASSLNITVHADDKTMVLINTISSIPVSNSVAPIELPFSLVFLSSIGQFVFDQYTFYKKMITFFGYLVAQLFTILFSPRRFHWTSIVSHIETMGIKAIPIIGLLSFLIGMVLAYMSAAPFKRFGAQIFVINLLDVSILRELGVLLASIIVAGRTGASCTAEIGSMVSNEEVISMRIMGMPPMEYLVLPRVIALMFSLPLLTLVANSMGLLGGMLASWYSLDILPQTFWNIFRDITSLKTLYLGLIKAPVFAFIITGVGCFYGFLATGSSDEIGKLTTESVVQSLFLVIVADAAFAVLYSRLGL
ncbi:MAG: MlaE family ABC transporter permease [Desulfovibrionaceae bacterium]